MNIVNLQTCYLYYKAKCKQKNYICEKSSNLFQNLKFMLLSISILDMYCYSSVNGSFWNRQHKLKFEILSSEISNFHSKLLLNEGAHLDNIFRYNKRH